MRPRRRSISCRQAGHRFMSTASSPAGLRSVRPQAWACVRLEWRTRARAPRLFDMVMNLMVTLKADGAALWARTQADTACVRARTCVCEWQSDVTAAADRRRASGAGRQLFNFTVAAVHLCIPVPPVCFLPFTRAGANLFSWRLSQCCVILPLVFACVLLGLCVPITTRATSLQSRVCLSAPPSDSLAVTVDTDSPLSRVNKGTKLHFKSPTAERRHVLCVGVGGDRTHASCPGGAGYAPFAN